MGRVWRWEERERGLPPAADRVIRRTRAADAGRPGGRRHPGRESLASLVPPELIPPQPNGATGVQHPHRAATRNHLAALPARWRQIGIHSRPRDRKSVV